MQDYTILNQDMPADDAAAAPADDAAAAPADDAAAAPADDAAAPAEGGDDAAM